MTTEKDQHTKGEEDLSHEGGLSKLSHPVDEGRSLSFGTELRNHFLTGLIIVGPVGITLYIVWWFVNLIDAWVKPLLDQWITPAFNQLFETWIKPLLPDGYVPDFHMPYNIPGIGLLFGILLLMLIGALAANLFGRTLVSYGEKMLGRMPVVRSVYSGLKQIFETVLSKSSNSFQKVGIIEYPRNGLYAIVFVSTETTGEIKDRFDEEDAGLISVFLPTTPNPTSGFLLFVPRADIVYLDMSVEEAAKMVISAGLVVPEYQAKIEKMHKDARADKGQETFPTDENKTPSEIETRVKRSSKNDPKPKTPRRQTGKSVDQVKAQSGEEEKKTVSENA